MPLSTSDLVLLVLVGLGAVWFLFKDSLFKPKDKPIANGFAHKAGGLGGDGMGDSRDFAEAMKRAKKRILILYGSQTGTAEDYATRLAKEAKSRFGISSLVADPEDYDFEHLDKIPADHLVVFCVATYGEGEPTDNAVGMMEFLNQEGVTFSGGGESLEELRYVVFALGNRTYEHFCEIGRVIDKRLAALGAKRIGERGEGDDDKSMEEDYLAWKDGLWEAVQREMGFEEGAGGDVVDFEITERQTLRPSTATIAEEEVDGGEGEGEKREPVEEAKVYFGELSQRMLTGSRGVFDAKNPYPSPVIASRELFAVGGERNCVFAEFDIKDTGMRYQAGDHVGLYPVNPDIEVLRMLKVLGMQSKASTVIEIKSFDPMLAKVPFPVPTTYESVLRYYLDICSLASRQQIGGMAQWAPTPEARAWMERVGSDRDVYTSEVADRGLKLAEVFLRAAGEDWHADPAREDVKYTVWNVPFDRIISAVSRLQPRYYSISSSPKLHPDSIHVTAVVLRYQPNITEPSQPARYVFGVGTNYLLNLKMAIHGERKRMDEQSGVTQIEGGEGPPRYNLEGPRDKYFKDSIYRAPIHVRRSNFRLPTSPKIPVVMIGPGTGVAPFRGFVQERVALARKAKEKDGEEALKDWGNVMLFYGCRRESEDYLYKDEWPEYAKELDGKFQIFTAFSREPGKPKVYVQNLIDENEDAVADALVTKKGYAYICGDARNMAHDVERRLEKIIAKAKGLPPEDGPKELKTLKDRNRLLLDVWS